MRAVWARAVARGDEPDLYGRIGAFLTQHGLGVEPAQYAFAHAVLADPRGCLAESVAQLTEDGVRLTSGDIERLGGTVVAATPVRDGDGQQAESLVERTHDQIAGFAGLVESIHDETRVFGHDLAASLAEMPRDGAIARTAQAMIERIRSSEARLAEARRESQTLRRELEAAIDSARSDPLTGLANRRAFEDAIAALPDRTPVTIAICDVDHFKAVNDAHGHDVGDRVLVAIGRTLSEACAPHLVARHGGEEFTILFADMPPGDARDILDAACAAIAAKRYRIRGSDARLDQVTLSAGIASACIDEDPAATLVRADAALYAAKHAGRNRVEIAPMFGP